MLLAVTLAGASPEGPPQCTEAAEAVLQALARCCWEPRWSDARSGGEAALGTQAGCPALKHRWGRRKRRSSERFCVRSWKPPLGDGNDPQTSAERSGRETTPAQLLMRETEVVPPDR